MDEHYQPSQESAANHEPLPPLEHSEPEAADQPASPSGLVEDKRLAETIAHAVNYGYSYIAERDSSREPEGSEAKTYTDQEADRAIDVFSRRINATAEFIEKNPHLAREAYKAAQSNANAALVYDAKELLAQGAELPESERDQKLAELVKKHVGDEQAIVDQLFYHEMQYWLESYVGYKWGVEHGQHDDPDYSPPFKVDSVKNWKDYPQFSTVRGY